MSALPRGRAVRQAVYGITVERAASNLPGTGDLSIFQVLGGRVLLTTILGEVTTVIQTQTNAVKLRHIGSGVTTDVCATVDVSAAAVGTQFGITGTFGTAATLGIATNQTNEIVLATGLLKLNTGATNTGQMRWTATYIPLDDGATLIAA